MAASLDPNITDVALIFEGGGMRAAYTAAVVTLLLEEGLNFGAVYGISAGSSHTVNYVSRDAERARASFTDLVLDPHFGGWKSMLRGTGFFNGPYLYEGIAEKLKGSNEVFAFDYDTFAANPAHIHIESFDCDTGETLSFTKRDMPNTYELMRRVRASSSMPLFMPSIEIDGHTCLDGGMGSSWGIPLQAAIQDGFRRFFIVRTQEKTYRKKPLHPVIARFFTIAFKKQPAVAQATINRWQHYNALLDQIDALEAQQHAYVFYPENMTLSNKTVDYDHLMSAYRAGREQAQRELPAWLTWIQTNTPQESMSL